VAAHIYVVLPGFKLGCQPYRTRRYKTTYFWTAGVNMDPNQYSKCSSELIDLLWNILHDCLQYDFVLLIDRLLAIMRGTFFGPNSKEC
jgi:hypothetical protein